MGDTSGCQISRNNLAVYLQGVTVEPSSNITSEYFVTASLPSSASLRRVWQFTTQGTITGPEVATLTLDYTQAHENCPDYNITFEGALNGTLTVKNQVFSANKFMSYTLTSAYVIVLSIKIPKSIQECFGPTTTQNYSFSVYVNDAATPTNDSLSFNYTTTNSYSTTLSGTDASGNSCTWSFSQQYYSTDNSGTPYTDPSGTPTYTGYLVIRGDILTTCNPPTSLTLDITDFPSSDSQFVALLGIEFASIRNNPTSLVINWGTKTSQTLNITTQPSQYFGNYGYILVFDNSSSSTKPWSVQTSSANPFYIVTCTFTTVELNTVNIYDKSNNNQYYCTGKSGGINIYPEINSFAGPAYISFPTTPASNNSVQIDGIISTTFYLTNPSTGLYQGSFTSTDVSFYPVYYCTDTWIQSTQTDTSGCNS